MTDAGIDDALEERRDPEAAGQIALRLLRREVVVERQDDATRTARRLPLRENLPVRIERAGRVGLQRSRVQRRVIDELAAPRRRLEEPAVGGL